MSIDEALRHAETRASTTTARTATSTRRSLRLRRRRGRASREADHVREDTSSSRATPTCRWSSTPPWPRRGPDGKLTLWSSHADAALRAPRAGEGARDAGRPHPRHRLPERRRLRRQERSVQPRDRGREAVDDDRAAGQDHAHPRGGLLLPPRPPPGAMWIKTGVQEGRHASPAMHFRTAARRRRVRQLRRGQPLLHGRAADGHLPRPALPLRRRARVHQQAALRPQARPRHARSRASPSECHIDKHLPRPGPRPRRVAAATTRWRPGTVTANQLQVAHHRPARVPASGGRSRAAGRSKCGKLPGAGRGVGIAGSAYISGAGLPIYWNDMPHSGVQIKLDRSGGVTVFCGSTDIGQGSDSMLAYVVAEELGIRPEDIRVVTADTDLTPVDLGSYSSRVTLMTGNAAIQAARRVREPIFEAAARRSSRCPRSGCGAARPPHLRRADPRAGCAFAEAVVLAEAATGTLGAVGSYTPPRSVAKWKGGGVGPTPDVLVLGGGGGALGRSRDRHHPRRQGLDRARHRPAINPVLVIGQVEGSVYMGLGRGADGGAGLPQGPAQDPVDARLQEPDHARDAAGGVDPGGDARPRGAVRRQGVRPGPAAARDPRRGQRAATTRWACAWTRCRSRPRRWWPRWKAATAARACPSSTTRRRSACRRWKRRAGGGAGGGPGPPFMATAAASGIHFRERAGWRVRRSIPQHECSAAAFQYFAPRTAREAARMLADFGPDAMAVAGGTDLFPNMKRRQFDAQGAGRRCAGSRAHPASAPTAR